MDKRTETTDGEKGTITMPDEIDLSTYRRLDVSFTDGKGNDVLMLQFRRDVEILPQLTLNVVDPSGVIISSFTVFDLPV